ncbi:MAG: hypothetical protein IAG10_13765 [Planctomycetaceae bacterium]|nr:hypothetical protein [Planctomycetaceae bacterium]
MCKFALGLIALFAAVAVSGSVNAGELQQVQYYYQPQPQPYYYQPQPQQYYYQQPQPNLFGRMWNMEQRKNAWLRQTFFHW